MLLSLSLFLFGKMRCNSWSLFFSAKRLRNWIIEEEFRVKPKKNGLDTYKITKIIRCIDPHRWAGALRQQGEKGDTPKRPVFLHPIFFLAIVRFTEVDLMVVYVRRKKEEQDFCVTFCFFFQPY